MTTRILAAECQFRQASDDTDDRYVPSYNRIILPPINGPVEVVFADGTRAWYLDGRLHRDDGPAIQTPGGFRGWKRYGESHRDDGPALEWPDGRQQWVANGKTTKWRNPADPDQNFG